MPALQTVSYLIKIPNIENPPYYIRYGYNDVVGYFVEAFLATDLEHPLIGWTTLHDGITTVLEQMTKFCVPHGHVYAASHNEPLTPEGAELPF